MKNYLFLPTFAALGVLTSPSMVSAKVGDKEWAKCIWLHVPEAAKAWIELEPPNWRTDLSEKSVLLAHYVYAFCNSEAVDSLKPGKEPKWKKLSKILVRYRSKFEPALDTRGGGDADVLRCSSFEQGKGAEHAFLHDLVRSVDGEIIVLQQYFDFPLGPDNPVKIPQGLRVVPAKDVKIERVCQRITKLGTLESLEAAE